MYESLLYEVGAGVATMVAGSMKPMVYLGLLGANVAERWSFPRA